MTSVAISIEAITDPEHERAVAQLRALLREQDGPVSIQAADARPVVLPSEVLAALLGVVDAFHSGEGVSVVPSEKLVTTQTAADMLGISRPSLVKLLDESKIPYVVIGSGGHRRLRHSDVVAYKRARRKEQEAILD